MLLQFFSLEPRVTYVIAVHSLRYPLVGGMRYRHFAGIQLELREMLKKRGVYPESGARCVGRR